MFNTAMEQNVCKDDHTFFLVVKSPAPSPHPLTKRLWLSILGGGGGGGVGAISYDSKKVPGAHRNKSALVSLQKKIRFKAKGSETRSVSYIFYYFFA
jgi:hypothetical protein